MPEVYSEETEKYFSELILKVKGEYKIAESARVKGFDPVNKVEIPLAMTLAEKVVGLISTVYPQLNDRRIVDRILELEEQYGKLDIAVSFKIAEEIAKEKFCKFKDQLEAIDAAIRIGFAYNTLGVVSSPIEGFTGIKLAKTKDGKDYFQAFFSGPIRSAGTTASCVVLMLIDYLRELFGYAKFDPDEKEAKRYVSENYDYHERVTNLQYLPTEEEILFLAKNLPIQVDGEPTEKLEVSNYKDLPRVHTNTIRGGMCLIFSEGLAQKAQKGYRLYKGVKEKGFIATGWDFLDKYIEIHKKREKGTTDMSPTYLKDLVAGRPVFGHPSASGAFRFRYGRSRVSGFSATSIHPATMAMSGNFLSYGTQLKIEKPTKGCVVSTCDSIDGPIVKLNNGNVIKLDNFEEAKKLYKETSEILYFGDLLFPLGDVMNRNYELLKSGYVEEWWFLELQKKLKEKEEILEINPRNVKFEEALELSQKYEIPLHPDFIYYWSQIKKEQLIALLDFLQYASWRDENKDKIILPYEKSIREKFCLGKRALELLGVEHEIVLDNIIITKGNSFLANIGIEKEESIKEKVLEILKKVEFNEKESVLELINLLSKFKIKDKAGTFIGSRMGRPEKAKLRKLTGSPNVLFPVGEEGGRMRSFQETLKNGFIKGQFPLYYCTKCEKEVVYPFCEACKIEAKRMFFCAECGKNLDKACEQHEKSVSYSNKKIDSKEYLQKALNQLGMRREELPELIKGVRGSSNESHDLENLAKGILRAKHNLAVNKDGTIRYDSTELPITHFKPKEIFTSFEKLKDLGYDKDAYGKELESDEQILELKPHDIILPACPETQDERADDVFLNITKFIDDLLEKFYKLPRFYNLKDKRDLVGQLVVCMAPHNCAGVIGRILGISKTQGLLASPYMHAAMRRDCVYPTTRFAYIENSKLNYKEIGNYIEELIKNNASVSKLDNYGTVKIENNKEIYALGIDTKTKKLKQKKIKYFIKAEPPENWIKIKTATGREQVMTPRHTFIYLDEKNEFCSKAAGEAEIGDKIGVLKSISNFKEIKEISLLKEFIENVPDEKLNEIRVSRGKEFFMNLVKKIGREKIVNLCEIKGVYRKNLNQWCSDVPLIHIKKMIDKNILSISDIPKNCQIKNIFNNKEWDLNLKLDKELMLILGYFASEGYSRQTKIVSQVCFRIMNKDMQEKLVSSIKKAFELDCNLGEDNTKITICNKIIYYLFKYCFNTGEGAYKKSVPDLVYNVSEELVKSYVSAYFDGDGTVIYQNGKREHAKHFCFYSVNKQLLDGISLLCCRFGLVGRFTKTKERLPGKKVLERYKKLGKEPKKHILHHLTYSGKDFYEFARILEPINKIKAEKIRNIKFISARDRKTIVGSKYLPLQEIGDIFIDFIKEIEIIKDNKNSYCFEIEHESEEDKNVLWGEQIINARCDGDEAAVMLLLDVLINFSRKFLPAHRGGTQDAPLVLNSRIRAGEVDDQILDLELVWNYPLELYEMAEQGKHSSEIKIETVKKRLKEGKDNFTNTGFTHDTNDFNYGVINSSYKSLPTMKDKVAKQMELCSKLRAVNAADVARLIIERHFIRDIRGNLRKFSMQQFRCVGCNEKFRRPPMIGVCTKCGGKIIFTISEGSIIKYLEPALELANNYAVPAYTKQGLELAKIYIQSIFGKDETKQVELKKWF